MSIRYQTDSVCPLFGFTLKSVENDRRKRRLASINFASCRRRNKNNDIFFYRGIIFNSTGACNNKMSKLPVIYSCDKISTLIKRAGILDSGSSYDAYGIPAIHVSMKVSAISGGAKFAHQSREREGEKYSVFDSSIHFISILLTAIFPTTNHLGTFVVWILAVRLFFFSLSFAHFYRFLICRPGSDSVPIRVENV